MAKSLLRHITEPLLGEITVPPLTHRAGGVVGPYPPPAGYRWEYLTEDGEILTEDGIALVELERIAA